MCRRQLCIYYNMHYECLGYIVYMKISLYLCGIELAITAHMFGGRGCRRRGGEANISASPS